MSKDDTNDIVIDLYTSADETALIELWQVCKLVVPWNNPHADIARKLADSPELFFVGRSGGRLVASCMAGYDGHRGWIYYLAVHPDYRRHGLARQLVTRAESSLRALGCPKIDLMVRDSNREVIEFYRATGYQSDPVVVLSKRLLDDEAHDYS